ncbi:LOW QUALITY PROTEIN: collagen alpha-6(VI) chain [Morphnus guianensis]
MRDNGHPLYKLQEIASEPTDKHVYDLEGFASLQGLSHSVLWMLCTKLEEVTGPATQVVHACRKATLADVVFLVDTSTCIGQENFQKVKNFLSTLVSSLGAGLDVIQVGLAQYSDKTYQEFLLNQYLKSDVLEQIENLPYRSGETSTGRVLVFVNREYFTEPAGSRAKGYVAQVAIVITGGESSDEVELPARKMRNRGISLCVVGMGVQNTAELQQTASKPFGKYLYSAGSFVGLQDLSQDLCFAIESEIEAFAKQYADVILLVDSTENMSPSTFGKVKHFISQIVRWLDVGLNKYRIGLARFRGIQQVEFLLNTHNKEEVLDHIQHSNAFTGGSSKFGSAMKFLQETFFMDGAGSRLSEGTPVVVVITPSGSRDNIMEAAWMLEEMGVKVVSAHVGYFVEEEEKVRASSMTSQTYEGESIDLLWQNFVSDMEASLQKLYDLDPSVLAVCSSATVADIVFLVDEYSKIGSKNLQLIRPFLLKIVNALDIVLSNVRGGLVLYTNEPRLELTLDTFKDKSEILNYLKNLPYQGGQTYTGSIEFLRKKVFTQEAGSRKKQGVQQIAVVITDGQSLDDYTEPAPKLRHKGVTVYAMGIQCITESSKLDKIATYPPRKQVTALKFFLQLSNIGWKIRLCNEIVTKTFVVALQLQSLKKVHGSPNVTDLQFKNVQRLIVVNGEVDKVQFGVLVCSSKWEMHFALSSYSSRSQSREAVFNLKPLPGQSFTARALSFARQRFGVNGGSASFLAVTRILILTDEPTVPLDRASLPMAIKALKAGGINLTAVGANKASRAELEEITEGQERLLFAQSYGALPIKMLGNCFCNENDRQEFSPLQGYQHAVFLHSSHAVQVFFPHSGPAVCSSQVADLVFLIDSESIKSDISVMKTFMKEVVDSFAISRDKVHVGVVQYSQEPQKEFSLNEFYTDTMIKEQINRIEQLQSSTFSGKGLRHVQSLFQPANGGCKSQGISQNLVVITGGYSADDFGNNEVEDAAMALRSDGIHVFAVGIGIINFFELLLTAGDARRAFAVENLDALKTIKRSIVNQVCESERLPGQDCDIDLSIAIDISRRRWPACTVLLKQKLQAFLPRLLLHMKLLPNTTCNAGFPVNIRFKFQVLVQIKQFIFDSDFENYNEEIVQKFLGAQTTVDAYLNADFLPLEEKFCSVTSAKVKGEHGESGFDGTDGEQGEHGFPGPSGEKGNTRKMGELSFTGRKGPRGEPGEGETGLRGDYGDPGTSNNVPGPKGEKGNPAWQASWCPWIKKQNCVVLMFAEPSRALLWTTGSVSVRKYDMASSSGRGRFCAEMEWYGNECLFQMKIDIGDLGEAGYPGDSGLPGPQGPRGLPGIRGPPVDFVGSYSGITPGLECPTLSAVAICFSHASLGAPGSPGSVGKLGGRGAKTDLCALLYVVCVSWDLHFLMK